MVEVDVSDVAGETAAQKMTPAPSSPSCATSASTLSAS